MIATKQFHRSQLGMTLIEVVIVLALLAGLAGMTLSFVGNLDDESRAKRTRDRADIIRTVVLGEGSEGGRFLADMGRLPVLQDTAEGRTLSELYECPHGEAVGQTVSYPIGTTFFGETFNTLPAGTAMRCGWHGPYVLAGGDKLYDGFGSDWKVKLSNAPTVWKDYSHLNAGDVGETVVGIASWGRDDAPGETIWSDRDDVIDLDASAGEASLTVAILMQDSTEFGSAAWKPITSSDPWAAFATGWVGAGVSVAEGQTIQVTGGLYRCAVAGTSGAAEPTTWEKDYLGDTTTDGSVTWMYVAGRSHYANRVRVAVFAPYVPPAPDAGNGAALLALVAGRGGAADGFDVRSSTSGDVPTLPDPIWAGNHSVTYTGLRPGRVQVLACAFVDEGGSLSNKWFSPLVDVDLKPGGNLVTVCLTEELN